MGRLLPADPVLAITGPEVSQEAYDRVLPSSGLDQPVSQQFLSYVRQCCTGDLGASLTTGQPVADDLLPVFPATLELATVAILIGVAHRRAARRARGRPPRQLDRPYRPRRRAARLFRPDLLARADGACSSSTPSSAGSAGPGGSTSSTTDIVTPVTGFLLIDALLAGRVGRLLERACRTSSCRPRCSAISRSPISAA